MGPILNKVYDMEEYLMLQLEAQIVLVYKMSH